MRPITAPARRAAGGFSLLEVVVALAVFGLTLAVGVPSMSNWVQASKAAGATEFYAEGLKLARAEALRHNSASRIVLTENAANNQLDWQVDLCFPFPGVPCNDESGVWSTRLASAEHDPEGAAGFKSVFRSAAGLPPSSVMTQSLIPSGATELYFTSLGWVDTNVAPRLTRIALAPVSGHGASFPASALVITLAGLATKCDPNAVAHDSRECPP